MDPMKLSYNNHNIGSSYLIAIFYGADTNKH